MHDIRGRIFWHCLVVLITLLFTIFIISIIIILSLESYDLSGDFLTSEIFLMLIIILFLSLFIFKISNKFKQIWERTIILIFSKNFWLRVISLFVVTVTFRYLILHFYDVNVITDIFNKISLLYYGFFALLNALLLEIFPVPITIEGVIQDKVYSTNQPNQGNINQVANQATGGINQAAGGRNTMSLSDMLDTRLSQEEYNMGFRVRNGKIYNDKNVEVIRTYWGFAKQVYSNASNGPGHIITEGGDITFNPSNTHSNKKYGGLIADFLDHELSVRRNFSMSEGMLSPEHGEFLTRYLKHYYPDYYKDIKNYPGTDNPQYHGPLFPISKLYNSNLLRRRLRNPPIDISD